MLRNWKKLLAIFVIVFILYAGCGTDGMLATEKFFREDNPNLGLTPDVCFILGTTAFRTFRYRLAIDIIDRNLKDFPYDNAVPSAEYRRAYAYEKLGEYGTAITLYEDFLLKYPKDCIRNQSNKEKQIVPADHRKNPYPINL
jgi:tetratricopeptide (TPR) repeat protein